MIWILSTVVEMCGVVVMRFGQFSSHVVSRRQDRAKETSTVDVEKGARAFRGGLREMERGCRGCRGIGGGRDSLLHLRRREEGECGGEEEASGGVERS
jgi:hypothetical protein